MKIPFRIRPLLIGILVLMGVSLAAGQEDAAPVRAVLAKGEVRYVAPERKSGAVLRPGARKPSLIAASTAALNDYASYFGIRDPAAELRQLRATSQGSAGDVLRYRQLHEGYPVIGGELVLSLDGLGQVNSLSGEVSRDLKLRNLRPAVAADQARATVLDLMAKYYPDLRANLVVSEPELWVYDPKLIGADVGDARLVWRMEVTTGARAPALRELVLINAGDGAMALHFNQIETALRQRTHTANSGGTLPGTLLCNETQPGCTNGATADADLAHQYGRDTYNFYLNHHGRDSFDNLGTTLISSVNYLVTGFCPNAAWDGTQMIYCAGAPAADDVVGHELTHAVTDRTSNLFYYYQSGAINESLSDLWGEFVDITNGSGSDSPANRWLIGEDFAGVGVIRNMANPPQFNQPDRMRSPLYSTSPSDDGGVHRNSGVNNKAVTLMVDGGQFNGFTVTGMGIDKVAALYYRVQTQHLTSGSDYEDLYLALNQACRNLIGGPDGILAGDCVQVANATNAVEMSDPPTNDAFTDAFVCHIGQVPVNAFYDSFEDAAANARWVNTWLTGNQGTWYRALLATAGAASFFTPGAGVISNHALTMVDPVIVPANAFMHFRHLFDQEQASGNWDGGLVEYSTDGGITWLDLDALFLLGKGYSGVLSSGFGNPAQGRRAFVGASHGFVSTLYDLGSLAGQSVRLRFRNTSDSLGYTGLAWAIDEVRIYNCGTDTSQNLAPLARAGTDQAASPSHLVTLDGSASSDPDGNLILTQWTQVSGTQVSITQSGRMMSFLAPPTPAQEQLVFRLTVVDNRGFNATDDVTVTVINQQPLANAGADQSRKPRDTVLLQGAAMDSDGTIASYSWSQIAGPAAGLDKSFTIPLLPVTAQGFWLSTLPFAAGASFLYLNFSPNVLTNTGGSVLLRPGSEFSICQQVTGNTCNQRYRLNLTGAVMAPITTDATQPRTWTLQGVQVSDGTPVSGTFMFNADTAAVTNIQVSSPQPTAQVLSFRAPSVSGSATLTFRLTSTDNYGGAGTDDVAVTVTNQPPTVNAGVDLSVKPRATVQLAGTVNDPDGGVPGIAWSQVSGPTVVLSSAGTSTPSFIAPSVLASGTVVLRMRATDIDGAIVNDEVTTFITNQPPTVNAGVDLFAKPRATVQLAGTVGDPDGGVPGIAWSQVSGPAVVLSNVAAGTPSFVAPSVIASGTVVLRMTVTDIDGAQAVDEVAITLSNVAPTVSGGADQSTKAGATVKLTGSGTDTDGLVSSYSWVQTGGPSVSLSGGSTAKAQFKAPSASTAATLTFQLTVTDNDGASAVDLVTVNVAAKSSGGGGSLDVWLLLALLGLMAGRSLPASRRTEPHGAGLCGIAPFRR